ncbi:MAG: hypothetical protein ACOX2F_08610 [bacterium]
MKKILIILLLSTLAFACEKGNSSNNNRHNDELGEQADDEEASDEHIEETWHIAPVVECKKDSDCLEPDKEFCDPYGECQCKVSDNYIIRYKGKCIEGLEGNRLFCGNNSYAFSLKHSVPRKGRVGFASEKTDVICACNPGFYGLNCEYKNLDYSDKFPVGDEYFLPEPNCSKDEECEEGMKCSETGYCYCEGEVEFTDPVLKNAIMLATGKTSFTGEDLLSITKLTLERVSTINNMKCLSNLRALQVIDPTLKLEFEELSNLQSLQLLVIFGYEGTSDYSPILKLKKLISLHLGLTEANYRFLEKMDPSNNIEAVYLDFFRGDFPESFNFLNNFKKLTAAAITFGQNTHVDNDCSIDLSNIANNKEITHLKVYSGNCEIKEIEKLEELTNLQNLFIGHMMLLEGAGNRQLQLSSFPVLKNVTQLFIDSTIFDGKIIDKFPNLTILHIWQEGVPIKKLDFMEGLVNLQMFGFSDDINLVKDFEHNKYDLINMRNLRTLSIYPYKSRNYEFLKKLKHVEDLVLFQGTEQLGYWDSMCLENYKMIGATGDDYPESLLYLAYLHDDTYHLDNVSSFKKNCDKGGAICNEEFRKKFYFNADVDGSLLYLCPNPIKKDDSDVKYLVEKGVSLTLGSDKESCATLYRKKESKVKTNPPLFKKQKIDFRVNHGNSSLIRWATEKKHCVNEK